MQTVPKPYFGFFILLMLVALVLFWLKVDAHGFGLSVAFIICAIALLIRVIKKKLLTQYTGWILALLMIAVILASATTFFEEERNFIVITLAFSSFGVIYYKLFPGERI